MINLEEHIVEIEGKKFIPYDIAVKALNNITTNKISESEKKLEELFDKFNNLKLDD
jgi:hypothetical protein